MNIVAFQTSSGPSVSVFRFFIPRPPMSARQSSSHKRSPLRLTNARLMHSGLFIVILARFFVSPVVALVTNRTIDDTFGDPITGQQVVFMPSTPGIWKTQDCTDCVLNPDASNAFGGTYTSATYFPALRSMFATLTFQGTPIHPRFPSSGFTFYFRKKKLV